MAAVRNCLLFALTLGVCYASEVFDRAIDNANGCKNTCENTFAPHTYENGEQSDSCQRGCRLYAIMSFIHNHNDENASMSDCLSSCEEAYPNSTESCSACKSGCNNQRHAPPPRGAPQGQDEVDVHVLYPLMYMHGVYSNVIDKVYRHMEVSWSLFMQADNGQLVVVRSPPRQIDVMPGDDEDIPDGLPWMDDKTSGYLETNLASQDPSATPRLNFRASQLRSAHQDGLRLSSDEVSRSDWLSCMARKTGVARIILCFLILATAGVMIWFCLTAAATAPEQHLSINGDLEYLREKDSFQLLHPQARVEARPLPVKIRVERI